MCKYFGIKFFTYPVAIACGAAMVACTYASGVGGGGGGERRMNARTTSSRIGTHEYMCKQSPGQKIMPNGILLVFAYFY